MTQIEIFSTIAVVLIVAIISFRYAIEVIQFSRWPSVRLARAKSKLLELKSKPTLPGIADSFQCRVDSVDWTQYDTAYGPAFDLPVQLVQISKNVDALEAIGAISNHLCHQASYVTNASAVAFPFLTELLNCDDDEIVKRLLYGVFDPFASATNPSQPDNQREGGLRIYEAEIFDSLLELKPRLEDMIAGPHEEISVAAQSVLEEIEYGR